jgi:hypothetical protein
MLVALLLTALLALPSSSSPAIADREDALAAHGQAAPAVLDLDPAGREAYRRGRAALLALQLEEADARFADLDGAAPAVAAYGRLQTGLYRALFRGEDADYDAFFERLGLLYERVDEARPSRWTALMAADAALFDALAQGKRRSYAKAALAARRASSRFEALLEAHPDFDAAYRGAGLLHVAAGSVPSGYGWLVRMLGFDGTVGQGLDELERAARAETLGSEEAAAIYALTDLTLNEHKRDGLGLLRRVYRQSGNSPLLGYLYGFGLLSDRKGEEAEHVLAGAVRRLDASGGFPLPFPTFYHAEALFRQNDFARAAAGFERFLDQATGEGLVARAHLRAGLAYEMQGDETAATLHYAAVRSERDFDSDEAALREAKERLARPMNETERVLLKAQNAYDGGRYAEAVRLLQPVFTDDRIAGRYRAEAAYRTGRAHHGAGDLRDALRHYRWAISHPGGDELRWAPWSQFYAGQVLEEQGDRIAARRAYERALDWPAPYDYHRGLEQRAKTALERLE